VVWFDTPMRLEATATSMSWIPSEIVTGPLRAGFETGLAHYDPVPPDRLGPDDVERMRAADLFRFANVLSGWADVEDGAVVAAGFAEGSGLRIGVTRLQVGRLGATFRAGRLPTVQREPDGLGTGEVRLVQTVGGRTGAPLPRPVPHRQLVQWSAPVVWSTLTLTLRADGSSEVALTGASTFPRHWVYGTDGRLVAKTGVTDQSGWIRDSFGARTPWGDQDSPALVVEAESDLERQMSHDIMRGGRPEVRRLRAGEVLTRQGEAGDELYLVLDGVLEVAVDGAALAQVGPGAVLGERALLEGGTRTSTLTAATKVAVAVARRDAVDLDRLRDLAGTHRREHD
jgi:hypothetical protein